MAIIFETNQKWFNRNLMGQTTKYQDFNALVPDQHIW